MGMRGLLALLLVFGPVCAVWAGPVSGTVAAITDGDTFVLADGQIVRLLDINTPEIAHDRTPADPYGNAAASALRQILPVGSAVSLEYSAMEHDVYGRLLAHAYRQGSGKEGGGFWVNGWLVANGMAHVYTFADNALRGGQLLQIEEKARAEKRGLWADPRWQTRDAARCCKPSDLGAFMLVEGKILHVGRVKDRTYFNFGDDWKTDFTVFVTKKDERWFKKAGITDLAKTYSGKKVRVRGVLQPVNGVMVRVTHPEQMQVME